MATIETFLDDLARSLDPAARTEFGQIERLLLERSMEACGMSEYPAIAGDPDGERASGLMECEICGRDYGSHPVDWRVIGYGDVPFLNVLCDGRRVKL
jgi:hypothetical protein